MSEAAAVAEEEPRVRPTGLDHFDVLIIGAGISGIGAAYHLRQQRPGTRFVILDAQPNFGGTWITHTYPGIRSDSDLYTFGYRFKPWTKDPIATADQILTYLGEVIDENELGEHIRYNHEVLTAEWRGEDAAWTICATRKDTGQAVKLTGNFLWMCQGYYRHSEGQIPAWPGLDDFQGQVISPQKWPSDFVATGKEVVVVGSGATAATLVPTLAPQCRHVVMLQRSPTYFRTGRNAIELADTLRELKVDETWIHEIVRRKIVYDNTALLRRANEDPEQVKEELLAGVRAALGPVASRYEADFTPRYGPWKQRIAFTPDGDLFKSLVAGTASVVTDTIQTFTEDGILLSSGKHLKADVVVAATGFNMNVLGDIEITVDGTPLEFHKRVTFRGIMFTGLPNFAWTMGYFRSSWTLRVDLVADFVCRLLEHMAERDVRVVWPELREVDLDMPLSDWADPNDFNPTYLLRSNPLMPKQGNIPDWQNAKDYWFDKMDLPKVDLESGILRYE